MKMSTIFLTALATPLLAGALADESQTRQAMMTAVSANGKQMIAYQWKQKATVVRKGTPLEPTIEELHFDAAGQLQRMTLSKPQEKRMGPIKAHKAAEVREDVIEVMQLARRHASPLQIGQLIQQGEVWEGTGNLRLQARSQILPTDEAVMTVSRATYLPTRINVKTQHDGSPVTIAIDYQQLPNGPSMMSRMMVRIPGREIAVNVESFDFVRLAVP